TERASSLPPHPHPSTPKTSIFIESLLTVYPDDGEMALDGESEKAKRTGLCQPVLFYVRT
ncbi:hypothetical protein, partial [Bilophila wadsworthia]|uniref:hypothetical protein n=1 Tax=Bilophila wadsworthia TaxID=35833 RepID=UPI00243001EC